MVLHAKYMSCGGDSVDTAIFSANAAEAARFVRVIQRVNDFVARHLLAVAVNNGNGRALSCIYWQPFRILG